MGQRLVRNVIRSAAALAVAIGLTAGAPVFAQQQTAPAPSDAQAPTAGPTGLREAASGGPVQSEALAAAVSAVTAAQARVKELSTMAQAATDSGDKPEEVDALTDQLAAAIKAELAATRRVRLLRLNEAAGEAEKLAAEASAPVTLPTAVSPEADQLKAAIAQSVAQKEAYKLRTLRTQYDRARAAEDAAKVAVEQTAKVTTAPEATEITPVIVFRAAKVIYEDPPTICVVWEPGDCSPGK